MNILAHNDIKLNDTQSLNAKGPAVYNRTWDNTASQILDRKTYVAANDGGLGKKGDILYKNIQYIQSAKDPVRYVTTPSDFLFSPYRGEPKRNDGSYQGHNYLQNGDYGKR